MIYDRLEHIGRYRGLGAHLNRAIDFLTKADVALLTGRGEIDGDRVYYMEQNPQLRALQDAKWERHERYIDIQIALTEGEDIYACPMEDVEDWSAFDAQKDCAFSEQGAKGARLAMQSGAFAIFFPHDAHMPCVRAGAAETTRKIVVKVLA